MNALMYGHYFDRLAPSHFCASLGKVNGWLDFRWSSGMKPHVTTPLSLIALFTVVSQIKQNAKVHLIAESYTATVLSMFLELGNKGNGVR